MVVEDKINKEATDSKTLIEVVEIIINKGINNKMRFLSHRNNEVAVVEATIIEVIIKETKMILTLSHRMHHQDQTSLKGKTMMVTISKDLFVMVTKLRGRIKLIRSQDNNGEGEVVNKEAEGMIVDKEVDVAVVVGTVMILLGKQLIQIENIRQLIL